MKNKKWTKRDRVLLTAAILLLVILALRLIGSLIGGPVYDFITAAFPWVCLGAGVASIAAAWTAERK